MDTGSDLIVTLLGSVSAAATVVIAASAGITAWLTHSLVKENKLLRKIGQEPKIIAFLKIDERAWGCFDFVLMNIGRGPARNIEYQFDFDERFYANGRVSQGFTFDRKPFGILPQDERVSMFFGSGAGLLGEDGLPAFRAKVKWQNLAGIKYEEEYEIDVRQFLGMTRPSTPADHEVLEALKKISKRLDGFASASPSTRLKVETIPSGEER